jgi:hypothetical protein
MKENMIKTKTVQMIEVQEWDDLVEKTYGRQYSFQQQDGCKERGTFEITIPEDCDDDWPSEIPEEINGEKMGVNFSTWLARDPKEWNGDEMGRNYLYLFWLRNFYPNVQVVANDLHAKGLIPEGKYTINIDW